MARALAARGVPRCEAEGVAYDGRSVRPYEGKSIPWALLDAHDEKQKRKQRQRLEASQELEPATEEVDTAAAEEAARAEEEGMKPLQG